MKPKREMVRIVRTPQGAVEVDHTGKQTGRGAYLCSSWACWELGLKKQRLGHSLGIQIAPEYVSKLKGYAEGLKQEAEQVGELKKADGR